MKIILTRPVEDATPLAEKLRAMGHHPVIAPLMKIEPLPVSPLPQTTWQALLLTSANGIRSFPLNTLDKTMRVITVGPQSRQAAKQAGFVNVQANGGDVNALARWIARSLSTKDGPLLYLTGTEISGDLSGQLIRAGFAVERYITYRAVPESLKLHKSAVQSAAAVVLYSPRSAKLWISEMAALSHNPDHICHYCLSANVASLLPKDWPRQVAAQPGETAMLALLEKITKPE